MQVVDDYDAPQPPRTPSVASPQAFEPPSPTFVVPPGYRIFREAFPDA